jgi:hypothetical protein
MKTPYSHALSPIVRPLNLNVERCNGEWQYQWVEYDPSLEGSTKVEPKSFDDIASKLEQALQSDDVKHETEVDAEAKPKGAYSPLGEFLYGLENLRKKTQKEDEEQQGEEVAPEVQEEV